MKKEKRFLVPVVVECVYEVAVDCETEFEAGELVWAMDIDDIISNELVEWEEDFYVDTNKIRGN